MVKIYYENEQKKFRVSAKIRSLIADAVLATLIYEEFPYSGEVSVTFTDDEKIRILNRDYRSKDSATDVLSFPMYDFAAGEKADTDHDTVMLGDIVISLERAAAQAELYNHSFEREVAFLAVHSTLHLLGYDHETSEEDEEDMFARQRVIKEYMFG